MTSRSLLIGLARLSSASGSPNNFAKPDDVNDQVTTSTSPRAARTRLASRSRRWPAVRTARDTGDGLSIATEGISSNP